MRYHPEHKTLGFCTDCHRQPKHGRMLCLSHLIQSRDRKARSRANIKTSGCCAECGRPRTEDGTATRCPSCAANHTLKIYTKIRGRYEAHTF